MRNAAVAVGFALFAVPLTHGRVLPAAPLTERVAVPAVQERTNRSFVMIEGASGAPPFETDILTPPGLGPKGMRLVRYDSTGENEPRVLLPSSVAVSIGATAVSDGPGEFTRVLTYTDRPINSDNPSRRHRFLYSSSGSFFQLVSDGAPPKIPPGQDRGGPLARENAEGTWMRPGTSEYPFILLVDHGSVSGELQLIAVAEDGTPKTLGFFGPTSDGADDVARFIGGNRDGSRVLIAGTALLTTGALAPGIRIVNFDGQLEDVLPLPSGNPGLDGWITPDGTVYLIVGNPGEPRALQTYANGQRIDSIPLGSLGFASPTHDFAGAWIIQRAAGEPTVLLRHTPGTVPVEMWSDPSAPEVEAIHSAESDERLLIQSRRLRSQPDGSIAFHTAIAVWEVGDPPPTRYDELFLEEGPLKGFVSLDVDDVTRGDTFVFDSAMSRTGPVFPPLVSPPSDEPRSDVAQRWGVVRSSLKQRLIITSVAHTPGAHGSIWRSDVVVHNQSDAPLPVELEFVPAGTEREPRRFADLILAPRETRLLADVVLTVLGLENANGALYLEPELGRTIAATSRTYNTSSNGGTFGMGIPAVDIHEAINSRFAQTFAGAVQGANFRTNVVVADVSGRGGMVWLRAQPSGHLSGNLALFPRIPPEGQLQHNNFASLVNLLDSEVAALVVRPFSGEIVSSVVAIDNRTNDPGYFPPDVPPADGGIIPAIAHAAGANGAQFRSDLFLLNPNLFTSSVTLAAKRWDFPEAESVATITLSGGEVRVIPDVFRTLFGKSGVGRLRFFSSQHQYGVSIRATSRLYTVEPSGATYGVVMPPVGELQSAGEMQVLEILGPRGGSQFRTNLALVELRELVVPYTPAEGRVEVFGPGGELIDEFEFVVPRASAAHYLDIFRSRGLGDGPEVALIRVSVSSGRITAFASSVDRVTNDSMRLAATLISEP